MGVGGPVFCWLYLLVLKCNSFSYYLFIEIFKYFFYLSLKKNFILSNSLMSKFDLTSLNWRPSLTCEWFLGWTDLSFLGQIIAHILAYLFVPCHKNRLVAAPWFDGGMCWSLCAKVLVTIHWNIWRYHSWSSNLRPSTIGRATLGRVGLDQVSF